MTDTQALGYDSLPGRKAGGRSVPFWTNIVPGVSKVDLLQGERHADFDADDFA